MYAIVEIGGRQWRVEPGTRLRVNRLTTAAGATHTIDRVLLATDGTTTEIGRPYVKGAAVVCDVLEHLKGPKVITYKYRRRENWRKTVGHRQPLSLLLVKTIACGSLSSGEHKAKAAVKRAAKAPAKGKAKPAAPSRAQKTSTVKTRTKTLSSSRPSAGNPSQHA